MTAKLSVSAKVAQKLQPKQRKTEARRDGCLAVATTSHISRCRSKLIKITTYGKWQEKYSRRTTKGKYFQGGCGTAVP